MYRFSIFRSCIRGLAATLVVLALPYTTRGEDRLYAKPKIGYLLTLSGGFANAGEDCRQGYLAATAGTTVPFEALFADSKNSPPDAISEFRKLIEADKVLGVYTHRSPIGMALNPISEKAGIPLLGSIGHTDFAVANKFAIQLWPNANDEGHFVGDEFFRRGYKRAALLFTEDEWTGSVSEGFRDTYIHSGGTLAFDQPVNPSDTDFRTLLLKIKNKSPDAVYINVLLPQSAAVVKQARDLQIQAPLFFNFYVAKSDIREAVGTQALEGIHYIEMETDLPTLRANLPNIGQSAPSGLTVASYVATTLLMHVFQERPNIDTPQALEDALLTQKEIRTPDYIYPIQERQVKFPLVVKVLREGVGQKEPH